MARMSAGMAGYETGDRASDRPIFTLPHAGVGGCIEKPFGRYHWQYKDWCSPDDALRVDDTETTQVEAVQATREAASSRKASPHRSPCAQLGPIGPNHDAEALAVGNRVFLVRRRRIADFRVAEFIHGKATSHSALGRSRTVPRVNV